MKKERLTTCAIHGDRFSAFICVHLNKENAIGFHEPFESNETEEYRKGELNAWCNECNKILDKHGEWSEEALSFAQIKLCCDKCFFEIKRLNKKRSFLDFIFKRKT